MKEAVRVLVVEQESQARRTIARAMKAEPRIQIIDYASTGYEAITRAITQAPDVVLMNASIETRMAGIFACGEINNNRPESPVILYGGDCPDGMIYKAFQMGAVNFLCGDYTGPELTLAVMDAFEQRPSIHHSTAGILRREFKRVLDLQDNLIYVLNVLIKLTSTEITVLKHFCNGMRSQEIAKILFVSNTTMKTHISHILKKFNLETMVQVVEVLHATELFSILHPNGDDL